MRSIAAERKRYLLTFLTGGKKTMIHLMDGCIRVTKQHLDKTCYKLTAWMVNKLVKHFVFYIDRALAINTIS